MLAQARFDDLPRAEGSTPVELGRGAARRQGLGHDRRDTCAFAREDLVAAEVSAIGQGGDLLAARGLLCLDAMGAS